MTKRPIILLFVSWWLLITCQKPTQPDPKSETGIGAGRLETKGKKWDLTRAVYYGEYSTSPWKDFGYNHFIELSSDSVKIVNRNGRLVPSGKGTRALILITGPSATSIPEGTFGRYPDRGSFKPGADVQFTTDCNFDDFFSSIGETGLIESVVKIEKINGMYSIEWEGEFVGSGGYTKATGSYRGTLVNIDTP